MELFIAVILIGVMLYELYTGNIPVRYGSTVSRSRSISRSGKPFQFWMWVGIQGAAAVVALLLWLGIIRI
jgi:hypothetical protein